ncbi:MAG: hypothetical protein HQ483_08190 [Rhodospirillales bacterium]|nr:hypothetical protein [Rhodospirillales bacterium]
MIIRGLDFLGRYATGLMATSVFVALVLPGLAHFLSPLLTPSIWGLLFLAMVRLDWVSVRQSLRRGRVGAVALIWMLVASPLLMWLFVSHVNLAPGIAAAMLLMAASAPLNSTPALAMMMGLNGALALVVMVAATFILPITLPIIALEFLGIHLDMSALEMAGRLAAMVVSALVASFLVRRFFGTDRISAWKNRADGLVVILMTVFAIAIMDGVTAVLIADPLRIVLITLLSFAANALLQLIGFGLFNKLGWKDALTLGFVGGNRNMGLILAVLPGGIDPDIRLYFALAQFPMYVYPALLKPLVHRWSALKE